MIKFSTKSKSWGNIDVLTDKAVYECKNVKPDTNIGIKTAKDWAEDLKKVVEKTGKEGILALSDNPRIVAKVNSLEHYLLNNGIYKIDKIAFVSDNAIRIVRLR